VKKLWPYVKPFSSDTGTLRTGGQTDLLYQYRASVCWRAIKTVESAEYMWKPTVQQYQQCCHLANGNKTCRSLFLFKNNNVARGSQGLVRQSSRNVALRVEQPSVLSKFFSRITIFCRVWAWQRNVCGWGLKIRQISSLFGPPCSLRMTS